MIYNQVHRENGVLLMSSSNTQNNKYNNIKRLFELMNQISEDQLVILLKELLQDSFTTHLFKLIIDMSDEQQALLLEKLKAKSSIETCRDRRGQPRKNCLAPVDYKVQGRSFEGFILDISSFGVFIETTDYFFGGQEISMAFSVPNYQKPLKLAGEIVWSSEQGIGVKFTHLTQHQLDAIRCFSENNEETYEIS